MGSISAIRKAPHAKTFGMELECYPSNNPNRQHWNEGNRLGFWEATYDGSLGYNGLEWVCQPMPYTMLIKQLNRLHKQLNGWLVDHRCGLHIHVSRAYWSSSREEKFSKFLRDADSVQINELFGRVNNRFASPHEPIDSKWRAVNVLHPATYEFRLWSAGDLVWTLECLRRTKLIVEYRGEWTYEKCRELFTAPDGIKKVNVSSTHSEPAVPAVRRVRRVMA